MERFTGILGVIVLLGIAFVMSNNKRKIDWRLVAWGLGLQLILGLLILKTTPGYVAFEWMGDKISKLLGLADLGSSFLLESFFTGEVEAAVQNFAFRVLPTVVFFSALLAILYHIGVMQWCIKRIAWVMQKTMKTSGSETTSVAGNIFVGQTESPLLVRPFIKNMTKSEILTIMTGGFATVAGGVLAIYIGMLKNVPNIASHLLAASIMSAPAAIVVAKIMYPETEESETKGTLQIKVPKTAQNFMEALGDGAVDGLKLAANIAAMLIAFLAMLGLVNVFLGWLNTDLAEILGYLFTPLAAVMGAPWSEAQVLGTLLGEKLVLTELIAYQHLGEMEVGKDISNRTAIIASYALCGFANFASIGIQMGGIGGIAPSRKSDIANLAFKAMIGGALASWITACIAGVLINP